MSTTAITHRWTGRTLFAHESRASGLVVRDALEAAVKAGAVLRNADLRNAVLRNAVLSGAVLSGAVLSGAVLRNADLRNADLRNAVLSGAVLRNAVLRNADLSGTVVRGLRLFGDRPFLSIGPIGSESRIVFLWLTEAGARIQAGCFFGTRDEFVAQLSATHGDNQHAQEYTAALVLMDAHARLWSPAE